MKKGDFLIGFLAFLFLFFAVFLIIPSLRAKEPAAQEKYVESETCMECHEEVGKAFQKTIHGRLADFELRGYTRGCEACHGPGSAHAEEADPTMIIRLKDLTPSEAGEICLKCHRGGMQMNWPGSTHDISGISCTSCHNPHAIARNQLMKKDPDLCYSCHASKRAQINYPSHHPIREKKMNCSSCHDSHGGGEGNIKAETLTELCLKCHVEKQGPTLMGVLPITSNAKLNLFSVCSATQATKIIAIRPYPTQHGIFLSSPGVPIVIPRFMAAIFRRCQAAEDWGDRRSR